MSRVTEYLEERGTPFQSVPHDRTFTAIDEAGELKMVAEEVLKTLVLKTSSGYALAVIPASRRLDLNLARDAIGAHGVKLASEAELERDFAGYELSAVPPLAKLLGIPIYLDPQVMVHDTVVFAATQTSSVRVRTRDVFEDPAVTVVPLTQQLMWAGQVV